MKQRQKRNTKHKSKREAPPKEKELTENKPTQDNVQKTVKTIPPTEVKSTLPFNVTEVINLSEDTNRKYAKREIVDNSKKYETDIYDEDNDQLNAADFEKLLMAPPSEGAHFFLNSEKHWQIDDELTPQYFNLNLRELTRNLSRIPFHIRHEYPAELFTSKEIEEMNKKAMWNRDDEKITSALLNIISSKPTTSDETMKNVDNGEKLIVEKSTLATTPATVKTSSEPFNVLPITNEKTKLPENQPTNTDKSDSDDELDMILNLTAQPNTLKSNQTVNLKCSVKIEPEIGEVSALPTVGNTKEDIQQWLDDILE